MVPDDAPGALTLEKVEADGFADGIPIFHPHTITVPGAAAGWVDLVEKFGALSLGQVLAPAVKLAEEGFPVAPITAYYWDRGAKRQLKQAPNGLELTIDGRGPLPGEIFRNPGLAKTMKALISGGKQAYYQGDIATAIVKVIQDAGGVMTEEDLANHTSTWDTPISTDYRGCRVWECPPNGQGLAALLALNILAQLEMDSLEPLSTQRLHLQFEAMRLAFADTRWYVADQSTNPAPLDELLSKEYAAARAQLIDPTKATIGSEARHANLLFKHSLLNHGRRRRQCLLLYQQQLYGIWHRLRPRGMGIHFAEPWTRVQPGC